MKKRISYIFGVLIAVSIFTPVQAEPFETDEAYNRKTLANAAYYSSDQNKDGQLTPADAEAWAKYGSFDADGDEVLKFAEFLAQVDLPDPEWAGEVQRNVVYKRMGNEVLLLDIYPPRVEKYKKAPVLYYTHGGGWSGGKKEIDGGVRPIFEALSMKGFVCVGVSYRLVKMWSPSDPTVMRDCAVDCRDGLRFLKKHEAELGIDMDKVVVFGSSAGGHLAQLLTWSGPDDFAGDPALAEYKVSPMAGVSWFGPSDFRDPMLFIGTGVKAKFPMDHWANRITKPQGEFEYKGADEKTRQMIEEVSPVCYLNKNSAPLLHVHGDEDAIISFRHAKHLKSKAESARAPVEIQVVKGAGHGWWNPSIKPDRETVEADSVKFILDQITSSSP